MPFFTLAPKPLVEAAAKLLGMVRSSSQPRGATLLYVWGRALLCWALIEAWAVASAPRNAARCPVRATYNEQRMRHYADYATAPPCVRGCSSFRSSWPLQQRLSTRLRSGFVSAIIYAIADE